MEATARAKVNLYLHVTGRRDDGYHLLDSLAVFPAVGDRLFAAMSDRLRFAVIGPFAEGLSRENDNLVPRAARLLAEQAGITPDITLTLEKNLPVASGIGGGSADAAAALRLLGGMWSIEPNPALALRLGADVPVCLASLPARMSGIGDILLPAPRLPSFGMVLINPGVAVSTASVFKTRGGGFSPAAALPEGWGDAAAMADDLARLRNDLEAPAIAMQPVIGSVLRALAAHPDCLLARMSGSGATCFGIFKSKIEAVEAATALSRSGWWCWGG
jgi:4-diphosphocytidyl-2-C-methyl-D-erythritol kinase